MTFRKKIWTPWFPLGKINSLIFDKCVCLETKSFKTGILGRLGGRQMILKGFFRGEEIRKYCPRDNCLRDVIFQIVFIKNLPKVANFPLYFASNSIKVLNI